MAYYLVFALVSLRFGALANDWVSGDTFAETPDLAAKAAAPAWHLDSRTCFPEDAIVVEDWKQNPGAPTFSHQCLRARKDAPPNDCPLNWGCRDPPKQHGQNTEANPFPTYYQVRYCGEDDSW